MVALPMVSCATVFDGPDLRVGVAGSIAVVRWRTTPAIASVATMDVALGKALARADIRPAAVVPVVDSALPQPAAGARKALARVMEKYDSSIRCVAYVVLGNGFQAAALRAAITGLVMIARPSHKTVVFASAREAADWIRQFPGATAEERNHREELTAAIEELCR